MKHLIKRELQNYKSSIREGLEISDDEMIGLIKNYSGSNKMINDFKGKTTFGKSFTEKQKEAAKDFFVREKLSHTILSQLDPTNALGKEVIRL